MKENTNENAGDGHGKLDTLVRSFLDDLPLWLLVITTLYLLAGDMINRHQLNALQKEKTRLNIQWLELQLQNK